MNESQVSERGAAQIFTRLFCCFIALFFAINPLSAQHIEKTKASVMSEDFVKQRLKYPATAKFGHDVVWEPDKYDRRRATILRKFSAKNGFGVPSEYVYKMDISYSGGEWTNLKNWICNRLVIEDVASGKQSVYSSQKVSSQNKYAPQQDTFEFGGVQCKVVEQNPGAFIRIVTPRRFTATELKTAAMKYVDGDMIIYMHLQGRTARGQEYAQACGQYLSYNLDKSDSEVKMIVLK